ncbi:MAG: OpgC domain-containing protein [Rhodomicrobium sp.]
MTPVSSSKRDPRVDVLRGLALLMIFVDHVPNNVLSLVTLGKFGFSDAAEVFVLLAGFSSMLGYGKVFERDGPQTGLKRIWLRLARLYLFQVGLLIFTLIVGFTWTRHFNLQPIIFGPIFNQPVSGIARALTLGAVPAYLDILPLYICLFAAFPLVYFGLKASPAATLAVSGSIWLAANLYSDLNLPNWMSGAGWFFDPFAWQFLFTIGAALAIVSARFSGNLPRIRWVVWVCALYLIFSLFEGATWLDWNLPDLRPIRIDPPDKTHLHVLRLLEMLALIYLALSSEAFRRFVRHSVFKPFEACGRHSLEVFAAGCVFALFGRLLFRTYGEGVGIQVAVNVAGLAAMFLLAQYLEHRRVQHLPSPKTPGATATG